MSNLRQLAQSLGLSITTVSRALDGYSDVSAKTRQRVVDAAARAGYQPNASARRLRRRRAELVAVTLPAAPGHIGPPHFLDILSACAEQLALSGLNLVIAPVPRGQSELEMCRRFVSGQRVDAMLLVRTKRRDERVELLQSCGIPFVTHGRTESAQPHAFLDGDGFSGFRDATERFIADGHTLIGHIAGPQEFSFAHHRRLGWEDALNRFKLTSELIVEGDPTEHGGYAAAKALMSATIKPTAILCATDEMAVGALRALREVPDGNLVSIVGHDDLPMSAFTDPPLSTMRMNGEDIGVRIATLLLRAINGEAPELLQEIHPLEFLPRASHHRSQQLAVNDADTYE
ncbi:LacI family transcriptional regulator [Phyllobacterium brassicacearum]|uniref:LacI family transcriptional regulator n=1 Tax=Phyllobacterium brassicacearum TaxID=314235 RepID=A0A2P7BV62_9HYPH|nr:LacI family DNA-binding transcriptional regulator [Phyllobacterium brassicacearum]PSH70358.1 LacI family transcriptional regulator [Phyllobacterium brassicacearum]TDQ28056.1 LacI family transcriptional regulator [Phyllobacterium brassicacearum]